MKVTSVQIWKEKKMKYLTELNYKRKEGKTDNLTVKSRSEGGFHSKE